jgi:fructokinase
MIRIGVDFGGTKIEAAALDHEGGYRARVRKPNPGDYAAAIRTVCDLVAEVEQEAGGAVTRIGLGMPGSISPKTGLARNANSTWLNGKPFDRDLAEALGRDLRVANDANCFALSEATDGAGAKAKVVFGVIIGTGCGGGVVVDGRIVEGVNGVGGEWGHMPLPWPSAEERGAHKDWCGRTDCLETWVSGTAFSKDYKDHTRETLDGETIMARARQGEAAAIAAFDRYVDRLGRALAVVGDILDPDVIVLGGGMSNTDELYDRVPPIAAAYIFSDVFETRIVKAAHGDSSGVRGAAWLWPEEP